MSCIDSILWSEIMSLAKHSGVDGFALMDRLCEPCEELRHLLKVQYDIQRERSVNRRDTEFSEGCED